MTGDDEPIPGYHWKLSAAMSAVYVFYVVERLVEMLKNKKVKYRKTSNYNKHL